MRLFLILALLIAPAVSFAADSYTIARGTTGTWNCQTSREPDDLGASEPVAPGDTVILEGDDPSTTGTVETREQIIFSNCRGTKADPIIFINDPTDGPVIFSSTQATAHFAFDDSEHFTVDGTGDYVGKPVGGFCGAPFGFHCGFRIVVPTDTTPPVMYFQVRGMVADANRAETYDGIRGVTVKGLEIDGTLQIPAGGPPYPMNATRRVGMYLHDVASNRRDHLGGYRENIVVTQSWIHDVFGEAVYFGNNASNNGECGQYTTNTNDPAYDPDLAGGPIPCIPVRGSEVSYIHVDRTGRDSMNFKQWHGDGVATHGYVEAVRSSIHHNIVLNSSFRLEDWELPAVPAYCTDLDFHSNLIAFSAGIGFSTRTDSNCARDGAPEEMTVNVFNNIFYKQAQSPILYAIGDPGPGPDPGSAHAPTAQQQSAILAYTGNGAPKLNAHIYNNTVVLGNGRGIYTAGLEDRTVSNNLLASVCSNYSGGGACEPISDDANGTGTNVATGNVITTVADIPGNPVTPGARFVNPSDEDLDFRLRSDSVLAINTALGILFPDEDYAGVERPQGGAYDVGAHEYQIPAPPTLEASGPAASRGIVQ